VQTLTTNVMAEMPPPIASFFAALLSRESGGAPLPGHEVVSQLALVCGSLSEGERVAQSLCDSGVLLPLSSSGPFSGSSIYRVSAFSDLSAAPSVPPPSAPSSPARSGPSNLAIVRSGSRETEGGVGRLLSTTAAWRSGSRDGPLDVGGSSSQPMATALIAGLAQVLRRIHAVPEHASYSSPAITPTLARIHAHAHTPLLLPSDFLKCLCLTSHIVAPT
jgi:hypothetical protein